MEVQNENVIIPDYTELFSSCKLLLLKPCMLKYEMWLPIKNFPNYQVSTFGKIKNIKTNRQMEPMYNNDGYGTVRLYENNNYKFIKIHRLVAEAFINNPGNKMYVDHIDNDRTNNFIVNLRFATKEENSRNRKIGRDNASGVKGICFDKKSQKWCCRIIVNSKSTFLGLYTDLETATKIITESRNIFRGEFARHA